MHMQVLLDLVPRLAFLSSGCQLQYRAVKGELTDWIIVSLTSAFVLLITVKETAIPMFNGSTAEWPSSFYAWSQASKSSGAIASSTPSSASPTGW